MHRSKRDARTESAVSWDNDILFGLNTGVSRSQLGIRVYDVPILVDETV